MRRPYVEPGHRSARPGIRHRTRSNGPDRKGRDPTTLASTGRDGRPARLASEGETDPEAFYSDDDEQGFVTQTDENAVTANEDIDGEEEDDPEDDDLLDHERAEEEEEARSVRSATRSRPAPAIRGAYAAEQDDEDDGDDDDEDHRGLRTPRNQSRSNLAATPRSRPRAYSRFNKLAPEEEDWALQSEEKRRKGGVFGRLKRLGRKPKESNEPTGQSREGANVDLVLGRSYGAVRELRSRKSSLGQRPDSMVSNGTRDRAAFRRGAAAAAAGANRSSGLGSSRSNSGRGGFDDDFASEPGTARPGSRIRAARQPPSVIASDDGTDLVATKEASDVPPRIPTPIALRDAENARSPQLVDPYAEPVASEPHARSKSLAESVQPSVLDGSDAASVIPPSSPLIPLSGPLSHNDAVVPSQRASMQSIRDNEIDEETMSRSRKPSMDLRAAAGGALGGLAAMIGFDALREQKNGLPPKEDPLATALGLTADHDDATRNAAAASTTSVNTATPAAPLESATTTSDVTLLPRRNRRQGSRASVLTGNTNEEAKPVVAAVATDGAAEPASELPYVVDDEAAADRSKPAPAIAAPLALGAGLGGLAAAAGAATGVDNGADGDNKVRRKKSKKSKKKSRALDGEQPVIVAASVAPQVDPMREVEAAPQERVIPVSEAVVVPVATGEPIQARDFGAAPSVTDGSELAMANDEAGPPSVVAPLNEKSGYTQRDLPAVVGAAAASGRKGKSTKMAKGSRGVEKLPAVKEDGPLLRRSIPPPDKGRYLLTPSVAPSVADPLDAGRNRFASSKGEWLTKDLSPQQTHYFLRELSLRELRWELDRAWLLTSFEKPQRPTRRVRKDFSDVEDDSRINDFDESSDEDLLAIDEDEDEEAVFRRGQQIGGLYNQPSIPDLPLLRFLFKNAFCTFPLFVAPEDKVDQYVGGPPDKATLARTYFFTGILPLLRAIQTRSLSAWVDRHGEGDGTPFSAVSTTGSLRHLLTKWASRYITAVLRVGPGDPYFEDDEAVAKESWPWPASNLLPPEAYHAFRKPLDRLKYGGYEVDLVGIRKHSVSERDYIIRLRRPNAPDQYVVRNDNDFEEFRRNLSKDLNPFAFVKHLPRTRGRPDEGESDVEDASPYGSERSARFNAAGLGSAAPYKSNGSRRNSFEDRVLRGGGRDGRRRYSSAIRDGRPVLGRDRDAPSEYDSEAFEETADEQYSEDDDRSDATLQPGRGPSRAGGRGAQNGAQPKALQSLLDRGKGSLRRLTGKESPPNSRNSSLRRKNGPTGSQRNPANGRVPPPPPAAAAGRLERGNGSLRRPPAAGAMDFEARRNKLRSWLRDTLSIREAGHANETQNFLTIGGFYERDLRRSDYDDIQERRREDRHRRQEHERDAAEAGDDVHDLREVRDDIWFDCVEGDGFLKMYDALRETPDYGRLPLDYQKMVSWGNLQIARWLYGVFVAGDESRANLARVQDVYESIPWKKLAFAMKSPVAQMMRSWRDQFLRRGFLQSMLHVMLEDEPETIEEDLVELRRSIGSEVMFQKLRMFVESPDDLKRLIRQHAVAAEVPLVAAIVRGSEQPKLNKIEVQRVMDATDSYQAFMKTLPSITKKNNHKEPGYRLIADLQRALRLLSLQRDGAQVRGMLQDPVIADAISTVFEPLMEEVRRLHKAKGMGNAVLDLQAFLGRLLDHLTGLRARVMDPLHAVNGIAEMLDDAAPSWYRFLRSAADATPTVFSFFAWFRHLAMTIGAGTEDLAQIWTNPPAAPVPVPEDDGAASEGDRQSVNPDHMPDYEGVLDPATMRDINSLAEHGRRKRNRQMEVACRWAAGDTEEHHPIQVQGDGRGKTRTDPYMPRETRPARRAPGLDRFRKSFREAVSSALTR